MTKLHNLETITYHSVSNDSYNVMSSYINAVRAKSWPNKSLKSVPATRNGVLTPSTSTKFLTPGFASDFFDAEP